MGRRLESRLQMLKRWREVIREVVRVVEELFPGAELYLIGAAEGGLTVDSDIDVVVVFRELEGSRGDVLAKIWEALEEKIPVYYPLEIHILCYSELSKIKGRKIKLGKDIYF